MVLFIHSPFTLQLGAGAVGVLAPSATSTVPTLHLNQLAVVPNETLIPLTTETEESPTPHRRADDVEVPQSRISRALDRTLRYRSTSTDTTTTGTNTDSTEYSTTYEGTDYENDPSTFTINLSSLPAGSTYTHPKYVHKIVLVLYLCWHNLFRCRLCIYDFCFTCTDGMHITCHTSDYNNCI